jgi:hypothetical protein
MALALRRVQNVSHCLSRDPMMVLHPASITPESMKRCCFRKMGGACLRTLYEKYFRFDADPPAAQVGRIQCAK